MAEILVPIDSSDVTEVIPPGEDIIYSSIARVDLPWMNKTISWNTHVLITPNGIAFKRPNLGTGKGPLQNDYVAWENIDNILSVGRFGSGFNYFRMTFGLIRNQVTETKEQFRERSKAFVAKFRPHLIEKKRIWIREAMNNPEFTKKQLKHQQKILNNLISLEEKRLKKQK